MNLHFQHTIDCQIAAFVPHLIATRLDLLEGGGGGLGPDIAGQHSAYIVTGDCVACETCDSIGTPLSLQLSSEAF